MSRLEYDDDERGEPELRGGRRRKGYGQDESSDDYRQKRSGKRFHRRKTLKDDYWPGDRPRSSSKRK